MTLTKDQDIIIVGAGVFGLSTALYLARDGYSNVTIFDAKPYSRALYNQHEGCDAASADVNKIFRASYGSKAEYQRLAYSARDGWKRWNAEIAAIPTQNRPSGLEEVSEFYTECGFLRLPSLPNDPLSKEEVTGLVNLQKQFPNHRLKSYIIDDPVERQRAISDGWGELLNNQGWRGTGVLDMTAGFVRADKACVWLADMVHKSGVRFIEGELSGKVVSVNKEKGTSEQKVQSIVTADGKTHVAALVIVAAGGWTPTLVPASRHLLETTAGSIMSLTLPKRSDHPVLWDRFSGDQWPVIAQACDTETAGLYSLPQLNGSIKIGYRATKYTHYVDLPDGSCISEPVTAYTTPSQTDVPLCAIEAAKEYIKFHYPELVPYGISYTRLCWYCDSIDNDFLIDYVPGFNNTLFVASGGSGHGFKFAPILGSHVLDALKGRETDMTKLWKWRPIPSGKRNGLEEGQNGPRNLMKQKMATIDDWKF